MAFDERLVERIRGALSSYPEVTEQKMFGGVCFLHRGNMVCGCAKEDLMLRMGPDLAAEALGEEHVRPMDFTGRPLKSMVYVSPDGVETEEQLARWVARAFEFVRTLPVRSTARESE